MIFRKFFDNRNEENKSKIKELTYFGFSILEISRALIYEFWYAI